MEEFNWEFPKSNTYIMGSTSTKYKVVAFSDTHCLAVNKTSIYINFHMHKSASASYTLEQKENLKVMGFTEKNTYWSGRFEYKKELEAHIMIGGILGGLYRFKWLLIDTSILWT